MEGMRPEYGMTKSPYYAGESVPRHLVHVHIPTE